VETIKKERISDILIDGISFNFNYIGATGADPFDDDNENSCKDSIDGKIDYFDVDAYEEDDIDEYSIGTFDADILYGSEEKVYSTLEYGGSITDVRYQDEIFEIEHTEFGTRYWLRSQYDDLLPEVYENRFMILNRVEVKEFYRGKGVLKKLVDFLSDTFRVPILIKPYPLQYEGEGKDCDKEFKKDLKKVVNAYKKCGFIKPYPKSEYMIKW
jgi:GNAT superfamily N-acetyltransferase